jgi:hypothetical protein
MPSNCGITYRPPEAPYALTVVQFSSEPIMSIRSSPAHTVRKPAIWFEVARRAVQTLPHVVEELSPAGPVFRLGRRRLAWLDVDGVSLVVPVEPDEGEMLIQAEPRTFSAVGRRKGRLLLRVHLAYVAEATLKRLLEQVWRERATRKRS